MGYDGQHAKKMVDFRKSYSQLKTYVDLKDQLANSNHTDNNSLEQQFSSLRNRNKSQIQLNSEQFKVNRMQSVSLPQIIKAPYKNKNDNDPLRIPVKSTQRSNLR